MTVTAGVLPLERRYRPNGPLDLDATLGTHRRGRYDPCHRVGADGAHWRTWRTPSGAATVRLAVDAAGGEISTQAWGSGADWALDGVPSLLGADDDWTGLELPPGRVRDARRRRPGMRLSSSGRVFEALVPAILEQLVTGIEARRTWTALVTRFGDPAPGPAPDGMAVMPTAATIRSITDWEWHRIGLDGARRRTLLTAASVAPRLEELGAVAADAAMQQADDRSRHRRLDRGRSGATQSWRRRCGVGRRLPPAERRRIRAHRSPAHRRCRDAGTSRALSTTPATRRPPD